MTYANVILMIYRQRQRWQDKHIDINCQEAQWVARGITECLDIIRAVAKDEQYKIDAMYPRVPIHLTRYLAHIVRSSLRDLKTGNKARVIVALEKASNLIDQKKVR